ncbi:MAG: Gfo/Idh/MocA family oxidoreductase [Verrucomicrobiota bacterium]|nr:Gfo/Idh/MocA family oxidoreductase [Verrucomicrobiota bacterium]
MKTLKVGIIGGGLMGREVACAIGRWPALLDFPVRLELTAVCDLVEKTREWFRQIPTVSLLSADYHELLRTDVDLVYVAVPHHLHEAIYLDVLRAGKDLFAEKPFGIDLAAAWRIRHTANELGRFVRCSSEFPFLPGAQKVWEFLTSVDPGRILEIRSGLHHASDLDPAKPINWKRQNRFCGEVGVMGDLGMHAVHLPFRLGYRPRRVYAQLQKIYTERPDGKGGMAACDTWDNAMLHCDVEFDQQVLGEQSELALKTPAPARARSPEVSPVPMRIETKRLAPHEMNTWFFEVLGTERGIRFSTKEPKTVWIFERRKEQVWGRYDVGHAQSAFPVITGGIFEAGFSDCFQQMWAAFVAEREGFLGHRFGCVTPDEAVASHELFAAALASHREKRAVEIGAQ